MPADHHYKVILVGDCRVGKTSYLHYVINNKLINSSSAHTVPPTIGVEYKSTKMQIRGQEIKINLWDTSGAEKYKSVTSSYYRKCQGVIIMFDLTDQASFRNLEGWFNEIDKQSTHRMSKIVIANKIDKVQSGQKKRAVDEKDIIDFCLKHSVTYKQTSALTGFNIQESFRDLMEKIYDESMTSMPQHDMVSQSWENNPDYSMMPYDVPKGGTTKLNEESTNCPKCC